MRAFGVGLIFAYNTKDENDEYISVLRSYNQI